MKIEVILPDTAICGVLIYNNISKEEAYMGNVILNGLDDGNIYDATHDSADDKDATV